MTDIDLKTLTPDTSLPTTGFLFGADSQATASPSVYGVTTAITTILGNAASSDALVFNSDTTFSRGAIRNFRFGAADAATALAQTLSVQSVVAGATTNPAGADFTITGSQGLGSGAGGSIIFKVAPAGTAANPAQNALATALTINSSRQLVFPDSATPSTLIQFQYTGYGIGSNANGETVFTINNALRATIGNNARLWNGGTFAWSSTSSSNDTSDVILSREAAGVLGVRGTSTSVGAALSFIEQTAPASPAANIVRIYAEDNGAGKTRLMALFATGAAQQIAIEP
jgi:hypothetical protein